MMRGQEWIRCPRRRQSHRDGVCLCGRQEPGDRVGSDGNTHHDARQRIQLNGQTVVFMLGELYPRYR